MLELTVRSTRKTRAMRRHPLRWLACEVPVPTAEDYLRLLVALVPGGGTVEVEPQKSRADRRRHVVERHVHSFRLVSRSTVMPGSKINFGRSQVGVTCSCASWNSITGGAGLLKAFLAHVKSAGGRILCGGVKSVQRRRRVVDVISFFATKGRRLRFDLPRPSDLWGVA